MDVHLDKNAKRLLVVMALATAMPLTMGARGCGGPITSDSPAPDVNAAWDVTYGDGLAVEITIGGATYDAQLAAEGGTVMIEHGGYQIPFELDCASPAIVCPHESWPARVTAEQRDPELLHQMWVTIPGQECSGEMHEPTAEECGEGTLNEMCEPVCDGEVLTADRDTFGVINEAGDHFGLLLGAGVATNGVNCALLGVSAAEADLVSTGSAEEAPWVAQSMTNGRVVTAYAGGCLWAGDADGDEELEALVLSASVKFTATFEAARAE